MYISENKLDQDKFSVADLLEKNKLIDPLLQKKVELLISLLTGSINDIDRVGFDIPDNILDKIKRKILLFDGDQTRFVYDQPSKKRVVIQGLSGTGKTELLLHKLKEIYIGQPNSKVLFTCHNKILASSLRERIPKFFNFMKVEEQIAWQERLWCVNAWGSTHDVDSGAYRYICSKYNIPFYTFSYQVAFGKRCKQAIEEIKGEKLAERGAAFDFILIDESQDFPPEFIELCELVAGTAVYVAGDIFQSIFEEMHNESVSPDYLLSKCYRTDPRTLMFSHGLGMGLFEKNKLRWLSDAEWEKCGYILKRNPDNLLVELSREPLRRFEDLQSEDVRSMNLVRPDLEPGGSSALEEVIKVIHHLVDKNPTINVEDIGIIFSGTNGFGYRLADQLESLVSDRFGWVLNKAYESKKRIENTLFISNKNNVKGLEFPFVICVADYISSSKNERNALYMMLTRSFIQTYLIVDQPKQREMLDLVQKGLDQIDETGSMLVSEPPEFEKEKLRTTIDYDTKSQSKFELLETIFDDLEVPPLWRDPIISIVRTKTFKSLTYETVKDTVHKAMESLA